MSDQIGEFDDKDPRFGIKILSYRIEQLEKEKVDDENRVMELTKRVATMEKSFQRGAGALIVLPIIGTMVGVIFAYGKLIFAPWLSK